MSNTTQQTGPWQRRMSDAAIAVILLFALWLSYACGVEEQPDVARASLGTPARGSTAPRVTQVASVSETPVTPPVRARTVVTFEEANDAFREQRFDEATDLFVVYTADNPTNVWGHYMLGLAAWRAGILSQAETSFERALSIDSTHVKSLLNLSRVLLADDRPVEALEHVERVLAIEPRSVDGYRLQGNAYQDMERPEDAIVSYQYAITLDPEDAWAMNNMALVFIRQGKFDDALRPLARAVEVREDVSVFFNNLGIALERTQHVTLAANMYQRAIDLDGEYEKAIDNLARTQGRSDPDDRIDVTALAEEFQRWVSEWRQSESAEKDPVGLDTIPNPVR